MNWPEIASCLRKDMSSVAQERVGAIAGTYKDKNGRLLDGFQANFERGGTKLVLQCEIGDLEKLDPKVVEAIKKDPQSVVLSGRTVSLKTMLDVMSLNRAKLTEGASAIAARALRVQQGGVDALKAPAPTSTPPVR
jgi:hypothetical protein